MFAKAIAKEIAWAKENVKGVSGYVKGLETALLFYRELHDALDDEFISRIDLVELDDDGEVKTVTMKD